MRKLLVICGPTAIGKTSAGIKIAKQYNGEIISADSRQVYKGLDIGTGKDIGKNSNFQKVQCSKIKALELGYYKVDGIPIWLLDIVPPDYQFSVADWLKCAYWVIDNLWQKNKLPIIVGGSGFYIQALLEGIKTLGVPPNQELRKKLNQWPVEKLQQKLDQLAPEVFQNLNQSDRHNPHRLIRKIELALENGKNQFHGLNREAEGIEADVMKIGLRAAKKIIYQRIDQRVEKRLDQGLLDEIKELLANGYDWDDPGLNTLGYKQFKPYFEAKKNKPDIVRRWKFDEHGYARQQLTWFKRDQKINRFDITKNQWFINMEKLIEAWYSEKNG